MKYIQNGDLEMAQHEGIAAKTISELLVAAFGEKAKILTEGLRSAGYAEVHELALPEPPDDEGTDLNEEVCPSAAFTWNHETLAGLEDYLMRAKRGTKAFYLLNLIRCFPPRPDKNGKRNLVGFVNSLLGKIGFNKKAGTEVKSVQHRAEGRVRTYFVTRGDVTRLNRLAWRTNLRRRGYVVATIDELAEAEGSCERVVAGGAAQKASGAHR